MSKTRDQMIARCLTKLGKLASGQTIQPEDSVRVDDNLETCFAELGARQIYYVGDYTSYEDEVFDALAECLASALSADFGADRNEWEARRMAAESRLELISAPSGTGEPLRTDPIMRAGIYRPGTYNG